MLRVLIVEDNALIACDLDAIVAASGHEVMGPVDTVADARKLLGDCDAALLDIDVRDGKTFELAAALGQTGRPFMFITGVVRRDLPGMFRSAAFLQKPYAAGDIRRWLGRTESPPTVPAAQNARMRTAPA
ncbi:response regulator [Blastochloris sulfoviridis]|uniref:Response regulator n=1 Tax=Blastochloris sulfoviridis TaxID=50712 RepID=A0A5M6HZ44_9HYPH|nr:response regulator [Blastochloris sulfoviridis]KAA5601192.1 response regulator [Blastochloris sulfoviridis]